MYVPFFSGLMMIAATKCILNRTDGCNTIKIAGIIVARIIVADTINRIYISNSTGPSISGTNPPAARLRLIKLELDSRVV